MVTILEWYTSSYISRDQAFVSGHQSQRTVCYLRDCCNVAWCKVSHTWTHIGSLYIMLLKQYHYLHVRLQITVAFNLLWTNTSPRVQQSIILHMIGSLPA